MALVAFFHFVVCELPYASPGSPVPSLPAHTKLTSILDFVLVLSVLYCLLFVFVSLGSKLCSCVCL